MLVCPMKWRPLIFFCEITLKSSFSSQYNYRRGFSSETITGNWKPLKNHEKCFLFHLNKLNLLLANQILLILCILIKQNVWYLWSLKILVIKRWFLFNFAKTFTGLTFCGRWIKKLQTFSRHFFWEWPSKHCITEFTAIFVCLLLSWSRRYSMKWSSDFDDP